MPTRPIRTCSRRATELLRSSRAKRVRRRCRTASCRSGRTRSATRCGRARATSRTRRRTRRSRRRSSSSSIHHDGCNTADMCFSVLQNERGLSVHFLLDNDGTIYQTIDLGLMAYHASEWNVDSIGVEMCNKRRRDRVPELLRGRQVRSEAPSQRRARSTTTRSSRTTTPSEQYDSFGKLCRALQQPATEPARRVSAGDPRACSTGTRSPKDQSMRFAGYIGHYHLWDQKWDPGPFDFEDVLPQAARRVLLSGVPEGRAEEERRAQPAIPEQADELKEDANELYKANEVARRRRVLPGRAVGRVAAVARRRSPRRRRQAPACSRRSRAGSSPRAWASELADRLDQLRADSPRHEPRRSRTCSSTRCTCTSPTSSTADKPVEWIDEVRGVEGGARPATSCCSTRRSKPVRRSAASAARVPAELVEAADPRRVLLDRRAVHRRCRREPWTVDRRHVGRPVLRREADRRR